MSKIRFLSNKAEEEVIAGLRSEPKNEGLKKEFNILQPYGRSDYFDFFLKVSPSIFPNNGRKEVQSLFCVMCAMLKSNKSFALVPYRDTGNLTSHFRGNHPDFIGNLQVQDDWRKKDFGIKYRRKLKIRVLRHQNMYSQCKLSPCFLRTSFSSWDQNTSFSPLFHQL